MNRYVIAHSIKAHIYDKDLRDRVHDHHVGGSCSIKAHGNTITWLQSRFSAHACAAWFQLDNRTIA